MTDGAFSGGALDWLSPFSVFTGLALLIAYALLGSTWLIMKTEGKLQARMRALTRPVTLALVVAIAIASLSPLVRQRSRGVDDYLRFTRRHSKSGTCGHVFQGRSKHEGCNKGQEHR